jgi:inorganic pyrophosphatase
MPSASHAHVITALSHGARVRIHDRAYRFGCNHYGEVPGYLNDADGDPWDVVVPGYSKQLRTNRTYKCKGVIGTLRLSNGNHKIFVRLYVSGYDARLAKAETFRFCTLYTGLLRIRGEWTTMEKHAHTQRHTYGSTRSALR